jgi:hypothetical protein
MLAVTVNWPEVGRDEFAWYFGILLGNEENSPIKVVPRIV